MEHKKQRRSPTQRKYQIQKNTQEKPRIAEQDAEQARREVLWGKP